MLWLLPDLTCRVLAEDENLLQDAKQQWMQLKLSRVDSKPTSLLPDPPRKNHAAAAAVFTFSSIDRHLLFSCHFNSSVVTLSLIVTLFCCCYRLAFTCTCYNLVLMFFYG